MRLDQQIELMTTVLRHIKGVASALDRYLDLLKREQEAANAKTR